MQSDCNYMLGNGGAGAIRYLDGENVDTHIHNMLELYNSFSDNAKPEWISVEEIEGYREKLTALYTERLEKYKKTADCIVPAMDSPAAEAAYIAAERKERTI